MLSSLNLEEIGQMLSDQVSDYITQSSSRKPALIEPEPYDDDPCLGYAPLERWGDCRFDQYRSRWAEDGHPMDSWKS